ncbi:MAG TPA: RodZ domain-containing protein [Terriglobales bacterium]|nr:RodZ domain-containing protein [Terriglobales bacterium]
MASFGEHLRQEREQRGITLDEISLSTKISTRLLRALEEEKFDQLPGGIFNKGFVRAYARHLGIDEEQAIADYLAALNQHRHSIADVHVVLDDHADGKLAAVPVHAPQNEVESGSALSLLRADFASERVAQVPWNLVAGLLLLVALVLAGWSYYHRDQRAETPKPSTPAASQASPPQSSAPQLAAPGSAVQNVTAVPVTITQEAGLKQAFPVTPLVAQQAHPTPSAPARAAALSASAGAFTVTLEAQDEDCWLLISVDDRPPVEETLFAPGKRTLQANRSLVVKAGDIGALDVFFNGKRLPAQGDFGEVRTLTFHGDGLQAPASKPPLRAQ